VGRESYRYGKSVVDGRNRFILKETDLGGGGDAECIHLAQDKDKWPLVNAVMNLQAHKMQGIS
jgi:hypothetical protein